MSVKHWCVGWITDAQLRMFLLLMEVFVVKREFVFVDGVFLQLKEINILWSLLLGVNGHKFLVVPKVVEVV